MLQNPRNMLPLISRFCSLKASHKFPIFPPISLVSFSSTSTPKISTFDYLVNHHQFSPKCAQKVSSSSSTNYLRKPQNADSVLNFIKENGFAKNQLETLVQKAPWILSVNLEITVKPKIELFQDLGFPSSDLADIFSASPLLFRSRADTLRLSFLGLNNVLGPNSNFCSFLKKSSTARILVRGDFDKTLVPNVEYLKSCGICSLHIARYIHLLAVTLFINPDKFKDLVKRVDEMGVDKNSTMFLYAVRAMGSMTKENWELKLKLFRDLGFCDADILNAFRVAPKALAVSEKKIKEVTQLLLSVEGFVISNIISNPLLLCYSVEKRLKPRIRVLKALEDQNLLKRKLGFIEFFTLSDAIFRNKYVIPYLKDGLGDLYLGSEG